MELQDNFVGGDKHKTNAARMAATDRFRFQAEKFIPRKTPSLK
jgi:hypothetical protein